MPTVGNLVRRASWFGTALDPHGPAARCIAGDASPAVLPRPTVAKPLQQSLAIAVAAQLDMLFRPQLQQAPEHGVLSIGAGSVVHVDDGPLDGWIPADCVSPAATAALRRRGVCECNGFQAQVPVEPIDEALDEVFQPVKARRPAITQGLREIFDIFPESQVLATQLGDNGRLLMGARGDAAVLVGDAL